MSQAHYTIQHSTVAANLEGLLKVLQAENKLHLLPIIQQSVSEYRPDNEGRVPLVQVTQNIKTIEKIINDHQFGCKVVNLIELKNIPLFKTLSQSSLIANQQGQQLPINVLITLISRYFSVITEVVSLDIHYHDKSVELVLNPAIPELVSHHQIEGVAVGLFRIMNKLSTSQLESIEFTHSNNNKFDYKSIFQVQAKLNAKKNRMVFSCIDAVDTMNEQTLYATGSMQRLFDHQFPDTNDKIRCQRIIQSILSFGEPTRENVSNILNISISTLQRKLRTENTNFKELLLDTRKSIAHDLLVNQKRSPSDLVFLLGYQSSSQFFKAFKSWYGVTPSAYRDTHKP